MSKPFPSIPPPGPGKGWNARNPEHPRYRTKGQVVVMRHIWRLSQWRFAPLGLGHVGQILELKAKNGGPVFYRIELMQRKGRKHLGEPMAVDCGVRAVRVTRQGEPIARMRKQVPGMSGKSFLRRFRKELRDEKKAREAAA